jgi:hypothetical protein
MNPIILLATILAVVALFGVGVLVQLVRWQPQEAAPSSSAPATVEVAWGSLKSLYHLIDNALAHSVRGGLQRSYLSEAKAIVAKILGMDDEA